jgi:hypothetical protein
MRAIITKGGIATWVNARENRFIEEKFNNVDLLEKSKLSEREDYLAKTLVTRGVLEKVVDRKDTYYKLSMNNFNRGQQGI